VVHKNIRSKHVQLCKLGNNKHTVVEPVKIDLGTNFAAEFNHDAHLAGFKK
jgi:hypothetical protein